MFYRWFSIFLFLISAFSSAASVNEEGSDTICKIKNPRNILITESEELSKVYFEYKGEDNKDSFFYYSLNHKPEIDNCTGYENGLVVSLPFYRIDNLTDCEIKLLQSHKNHIRRILIGMDHIYAGWKFNYSDKQNLKNSFEAGVKNIIGIGWQRGFRGPIFSIGIGMGISRYNSHPDFLFQKTADKLELVSFPDKEKKKASFLNILTLHVPLLYRQNIGNYVSFSLGGSLNFNVFASAISKTAIGNTEKEIKFKGLQQRVLSPELFISLNIFGIGIYGSWTPVGLFQSKFGPSSKSWAVGIDIITL